MARLNINYEYEASERGLFFLGDRVYERDGNDMNKRSVYGNDMSRCSVFSDGEKNQV